MLGVVGLALAGCENMEALSLFRGSEASNAEDPAVPEPVRLVERDVEAPEAFQKTDPGLWDGRPSLGGVWVAHPDVDEPERVIIRNKENGKFVIGALFKREDDMQGPAFQVSSDAADALGILAGAPALLEVTALRRKETPEDTGAGDAAGAAAATGGDASGEIAQQALAPTNGAADDAGPDTGADTAAVAAAPTSAETRPAARPEATLEEPFVQIGIFSVEENARETAQAMRQVGLVPTLKQQSSSGKTFWRVMVGPARDGEERAVLLEKARDLGFADAYAVSK